jgi:hypothetical protein
VPLQQDGKGTRWPPGQPGSSGPARATAVFEFRQFARGAVVVACLASATALAQAISGVETGFCRIVRGWTNYSTAFNATHDLGADGDFATVASFYIPSIDTCPVEYGVIVIWLGTGSQHLDFARYEYCVSFWSSLEAFREDARQGDLATFTFASPSGGSTERPDTITRGGRPAFELRFHLTNAPLTLTQCHEYLVGFAARARVQQDGELFVPAAPSEGPSDVQAGTIVPFGFNYLINAGGLSLYSGQLATELLVTPLAPRPILIARRQADAVQLLWPGRASCYMLQAADEPGPAAQWLPVASAPHLTNDLFTLSLPPDAATGFFRLVKY